MLRLYKNIFEVLFTIHFYNKVHLAGAVRANFALKLCAYGNILRSSRQSCPLLQREVAHQRISGIRLSLPELQLGHLVLCTDDDDDDGDDCQRDDDDLRRAVALAVGGSGTRWRWC